MNARRVGDALGHDRAEIYDAGRDARTRDHDARGLPAVLVVSSMPPAPFTMLPVTVLELTNIPDAVPVACVVVLVVIVPVLLTLPVNVPEAK